MEHEEKIDADIQKELPSNLRIINLDGKEIYILGTAHVSKASVDDVESACDQINPDSICVELCSSRHRALTDPDSWKNTDIFKVIRQGRSFFLLAQLIMGAFYRYIGKQLEVTPGAEMLKGVELAKNNNRQLVLADRDVQVTLKRVWGGLSLWQKFKLFGQLSVGLIAQPDIEAGDVEDLKNLDQIEGVMDAFAKDMPGIKERLIDERDIFLAQKIRQAPGKKILAIVGAGHVPGILEQIKTEREIASLSVIPQSSNWMKIIKWAIPILIVILFIYVSITGGKEASMDSLWIWVVFNGGLSALGVLMALGNVLTIIAAFIAAPLTSLNPMIAAGWVAGLVQAWVKKPTVYDFENLSEDVMTVKGFWANPVSRILLVVLMANLGSMIGTIVATKLIADKVFV